MSRDILKIVCFFVVGMIGGIFADQILWPYFIERPLFSEYRLDQPSIQVLETKEITVLENTALKSAIEKVGGAVVRITNQSSTGKITEGSGLVATSDGLVVTLSDLISSYSTSTMFIGGKESSLRLLKRDKDNNLALLKTDGNNLFTVGFADLVKLKLGERVFLVGAITGGVTSSVSKTVNEGIVKSFDSESIETNILEEKELSGSVLFNISGEVLGINTISEGKVISIPVSAIKRLIGM